MNRETQIAELEALLKKLADAEAYIASLKEEIEAKRRSLERMTSGSGPDIMNDTIGLAIAKLLAWKQAKMTKEAIQKYLVSVGYVDKYFGGDITVKRWKQPFGAALKQSINAETLVLDDEGFYSLTEKTKKELASKAS